MPTTPARIVLKRGREARLLGGHPWVYEGEIQAIEGSASPGEIVDLYDYRRAFLARGYFNPHSQIRVRVLSFEPEEIDQELLRRRLQQAIDRRLLHAIPSNAYRLLFSEADLLPGLIIDYYGPFLVVQFLTLGMELLKDSILSQLLDLLSPAGIYARNDLHVRELEGLPLGKELLWGEVPDRIRIREGDLSFWVDVKEGQKTGFFLDQRENRLALRERCDGRRALDCFCYTGAFSLQAAHFGAASTLGLDLSEEAISLAQENARLNGLSERCQFRVGNAFDELRALERKGEKFDLIILDPPAFTKSKEAIEPALRGYKEINLRALKLLDPDGLLLSCSCSYHLSPQRFLRMLEEAAADAGRRVHLLEFRTQAPDHPILLGVPETCYLKCAILRVV
ncbi:MAG: class I SAM-dependent rRNA methyltransferase [candidate division NC10 bacterium]|nr:class I SAM-dependent rRNA methyltransferase [candidate division NC10 bacterium]